MTLSALWSMLKKTVLKWWDDNALRLSAALSYYTLFSLAPLLIIAIAVAELVFSEQAVQAELFGQIQGLIGEEGAKAIQGTIERVRQPKTGAIATIVSLIAIMVLSTGVFAELQDALNTIWRIKSTNNRAMWKILNDRFSSFVLVIGVGFLLVVSLILSAALSAVGRFFSQLLPGPELAMQILNAGVSFVIFTLLFAMMFKVLPDAHIAWMDVWMGAVVTALLFTFGKLAIGLYLGKTGVASAYGAASSLAIILLWVYYSALILFLGAEFTYVYANEYGSHIGRRMGLEASGPIARADACRSPVTSPVHETRPIAHRTEMLDVERLLFWAATGALLFHTIRRALAGDRSKRRS
jgi:membrane protein